jgi:FAD/FMN-containing dehydrogenase
MRGAAVDPERRLARVNGGALLGELDVAAQARGLVCPVGVVGHTGVAGLTLGGGVGRLQRNFGLTIDNLAAVELVTADGRHVRASATEEPELFWGLRGAGWNFGVATAFEFRLQPFGPDLHRGVHVYPAPQVNAVWDAFRAWAPSAPDAVAVIFGIDRVAAGSDYPAELVGQPIVFVAYNHSGAADEVERDTAGLLAEIAGIARFADHPALAHYAGLLWDRYQSGEFDGTHTRRIPTGNSYLRYHLVEGANSARVHAEEFKAYYQEKRAEPADYAHQRALLFTARKLVRILFYCLTHETPYRPPSARPARLSMP